VKELVVAKAWKLGQWNKSLEETPANAYLIGQSKPELKFDGNVEEERARRINIADFNLKGYPEFQILPDAPAQVLFTAQQNRTRAIAIETQRRASFPPLKPEPYCYMWEGALNSWYENEVTGKYIKYGSKEDKKAIARSERKIGY
jgi:hypothetical protein